MQLLSLALIISFFSLLNAAAVQDLHIPTSHPLKRRGFHVPPTLRGRSSPGLVERQGYCAIGQTACTDGGCCEGICCGNGCCPYGYTCDYSAGIAACCPEGRICSDTIEGCTSDDLVECENYNHCCPRGEYCYLNSLGHAQCGGSGNNPPRTTTTSTMTTTTTTMTTTTSSRRRTTTTTSTTSTPVSIEDPSLNSESTTSTSDIVGTVGNVQETNKPIEQGANNAALEQMDAHLGLAGMIAIVAVAVEAAL